MFPKDPCLGSHLRGWGARRVPPPPQGRRDPPALTPRSTGRRRTALEDQAGAPGRPRRAGGRAGGGGRQHLPCCPAAARATPACSSDACRDLWSAPQRTAWPRLPGHTLLLRETGWVPCPTGERPLPAGDAHFAVGGPQRTVSGAERPLETRLLGVQDTTAEEQSQLRTKAPAKAGTQAGL